ncbi:flagellar export chaperone FliS [Bacillus sp. N9]
MDFLTKELIYQMTPQKITGLLYEVCIDQLEGAIGAIEAGQPLEANTKLQKVNDILERLGVGLNYEAGIIANQLDTLYNYMANQVIIGNMRKDPVILKEVLEICNRLASAWNEAMNMGNVEAQRLHHQKQAPMIKMSWY